MNWIDINKQTPLDGESVLVYLGNYSQNSKFDVCRFIVREDGWQTNNKRNYYWDGFGPMQYIGQYVTHWMYLPQKPE